MSKPVVTLEAEESVQQVREWLAAPGTSSSSGARPGSSHQGFPVLDSRGVLLGVVTRRDLQDPSVTADHIVRSLIRRAPIVVLERELPCATADLMVVEQVGRLPVLAHTKGREVIGIITRSDLLAAHAPRLRAALQRSRTRVRLGGLGPARRG